MVVRVEGVKAEMEVAQMPMAAATIADENLMVDISMIYCQRRLAMNAIK